MYVCKCPTSNALLSLGDSSLQNCSYLYANSVFSRSKTFNSRQRSYMFIPLVVVSAATLASFTACRFLSCTVPKRRLHRSLIDCQCCLLHLKLLFASGQVRAFPSGEWNVPNYFASFLDMEIQEFHPCSWSI
jgi:hypothetical protein